MAPLNHHCPVLNLGYNFAHKLIHIKVICDTFPALTDLVLHERGLMDLIFYSTVIKYVLPAERTPCQVLLS